MLFKSLHKDSKNDEKEVTENELNQEIERKLKKYHRRLKLKKILLIIVIGLGLVGGYKSLGTINSSEISNDAENQTFVKTYAMNYYAYPDDVHREYLEEYTLDDTWRIQYESGMEYAKLNNAEIYKVKTNDIDNITSYYLRGELITKKEKEDEINNTIYFRVDVAKEGAAFLVVKPVSSTGVEISSISEEERKKYKFEGNSSNRSLNEKETLDLEETLLLFIKTYNDNPAQAKLLTSDEKIVEVMDDNITLSLANITNSSQDEDIIYVYATIQESYLNVSSITKNYYFEIEKTKNKIQKMEVY